MKQVVRQIRLWPFTLHGAAVTAAFSCLLITSTHIAVQAFDMTALGPARITNVVDSGAIPDDGIDDTEALQKAFASHDFKHIYLPNGTYLVNSTIFCGDPNEGFPYESWDDTYIQGESRDSTIIKLVADAPGFQDTADPKAIVSFYHPEKTHVANQFDDRIHDLTIDANSNRGAIALDFYTSNHGGIYNIKCISSGGTNAKYGIKTLDYEVGPAVVHDVIVENYDVGICFPYYMFGFYLEDITIRNYAICGIQTAPKTTIVNYTVEGGTGPAIKGGNYALVNAELSGTGEFALGKTSTAYLRNVNVDGFTHTFHHFASYTNSTTGEQDTVDHIVDDKTNVTYMADPNNAPLYSPFNTTDSLLNLSIKPVPDPGYSDPSTWTNTYTYTQDSGSLEWRGREWCLQNALDETNGTVALTSEIQAGDPSPVDPSKRKTETTFRIGGNVKRLIRLGNGRIYSASDIPQMGIEIEEPIWIIEGDKSDGPLVIENMSLNEVTHASNRTVVFKNTWFAKYRNTVEGADVFIENLPGGGDLRFTNQNVWIRYSNPEKDTLGVKILNDGGTLWIGYIKTEDNGTVVKTINCGSTEMLNGFFYSTHSAGSGVPCLWAVDANVSYVLSGYWQYEYDIFSIVQQGNQIDTLLYPGLAHFRASACSPDATLERHIPRTTVTAPLSVVRRKDHVLISITGPVGRHSLQVVDAQGRVVYDVAAQKSPRHTLSRALLGRGTYFVLLHTRQGRTVKKFELF